MKNLPRDRDLEFGGGGVFGGGAGNAPKVIAGITSDGTSKINLGVAGASVGGLVLANATSGTITLQPVTGALGTVTLSLPAATDTLTANAATQTLTNKTISGASNTLSNIGNSSLTNSTITIQGSAVSLGGSTLATTATPQFAALGVGEAAPAAGIELTGKTINTDATGTVASADMTFSVTKNDANARTFHGLLVKPTFNTGASNTNTTVNILSVDTTNTSLTGTTINLLNLADAGTAKFTVERSGTVTAVTVNASSFMSVGGVAVLTETSTNTVTNKSLSGSSNTFSAIPVTALNSLNGFTNAVPASDDVVPIFDTSASANRDTTVAELIGAVTEGYINGAVLTYSSTTQVQITTGTVHIQSSASLMRITSTLTVTPSLSADTWYHCYVFSNSGTPTGECVTTAPATAYAGTARSKTSDTSRRYVGSIRTNGSSEIQNFYVSGSGSRGDYLWRLDVPGLKRALSAGLANTKTAVSLSSLSGGTGSTASGVPDVSGLVKVAICRLVNLASNTPNINLYFDNSDATGTSTASTGMIGIRVNADVVVPLSINDSREVRYSYDGSPTGTGAFIDVIGFQLLR